MIALIDPDSFDLIAGIGRGGFIVSAAMSIALEKGKGDAAQPGEIAGKISLYRLCAGICTDRLKCMSDAIRPGQRFCWSMT